MIHGRKNLLMFNEDFKFGYQVKKIGTIRGISHEKKVGRVGDLGTLAH